MQNDGHTAEVTYQIEVHQGTEETGLVDIVLLGLLIEPCGIAYLVNHNIGAVDGRIVFFPGITHKEIGRLYGEV